MTQIVNRVYVTPNSILQVQTEPFVLRVCLNNPNDREKYGGVDMARPIQGIPNIPYNHEGKGVCFETDYSDQRTKNAYLNTVLRCREMYGHNPNLIAVEGTGMGQWGEGSIWLLNKYRNTKNKQIASFDDQKWYMNTLKDAFPDKPFMCRFLTEPAHDLGSVAVGYDITENTYDDTFLGPNSNILGNQIVEFSCEHAMHGAEVYPPIQEGFVKNPQTFIDAYKKANRNLAYMCKFCYVPKNKPERDGLQTIYDFVTGVKK